MWGQQRMFKYHLDPSASVLLWQRRIRRKKWWMWQRMWQHLDHLTHSVLLRQRPRLWMLLNFSEGRHSNKKGRETCLFCYHFLFFRKCCSRSFCSCRFRSASVICPFFFFRCKHASSSSYTRFPSMINRPMDFLLKTGSNCYLASQLYLFSFYHMHILFSLS